MTIPATVKIDNYTYKVTSISDSAFSGNTKVKSIIIGKNVKKIGANAFKNAKKLTKITVKSTKLGKNSVGKNALKGTGKKLVIKVAKSKVKSYKSYFKNKGNGKVKVTK